MWSMIMKAFWMLPVFLFSPPTGSTTALNSCHHGSVSIFAFFILDYSIFVRVGDLHYSPMRMVCQ
jgi:hypothetical protein